MKTTIYLFLVASIILFSCKTKKEVVSNESAPVQMEQKEPRKNMDRGVRQHERIEELYSRLDLSEDQMTKFDAINDKYYKEMMNLRDSFKGERMIMRKKMMDINKRKNEEVKSILNELQNKLYQDYLVERRNSRMKRRVNRK